MTNALIVTGGGGVGKTTLAAALGVAAAERGLRTLVLTVDPAKRLASALGVGDLSSEPQPNDEVPGLWAAMLDAETSWHHIIDRHAPPDAAARLHANEFLDAIATRFPASQSYAAAEEMMNFLDAKVWDLVVVDTPPSDGGIGFFTSGASMRDLVGGKIVRWLTGARIPGRRTVYSLAGRPVLRLADAVLGSDLLERVAEFLLDLRTTHDGLSQRANEIERALSRATTVVVTSAQPTPLREAARFYRELPSVASTPSVVIFNRALPAAWVDATPEPDAPPALQENLRRWSAEARHQADARRAFVDRYGAAVAAVPWQSETPTDPAALSAMLKAAQGLELETLLG